MKLRLNFGILACVLLLSMTGCGRASTPAKTLEHDGGARITLHATCFPDQANCDPNARLNSAMDVLKRRASAAGYRDVVVHAGSEAQTIVVEAPGIADGQQLVPLLTSRGQLFFIDSGGQGLSVGEDVNDSICKDRCRRADMVVFRGEDLDTSYAAPTRSEYAAGHRRLPVQRRRPEALRRLHRRQYRQLPDDHAGWQGDRVGGDSEPDHRTSTDQRQYDHGAGERPGGATHIRRATAHDDAGKRGAGDPDDKVRERQSY